MSGDLHEDRTRVVCSLPLRDAREEKAFKRVIAYLQDQRKERIGVTGYIYSAPGAFYGYWWHPRKRRWLEDKIVLLVVDYKIPLDHLRHSLLEKLSELKRAIEESYAHYGSPQQEVWLVAQPVTLV